MNYISNTYVTRILQEAQYVLLNPTPLLLLTFLALVMYIVFRYIRRILKLPPGPYGLPILGMLPFIKKEFHLTLFDHSKKHGKLMSCQMGVETCIVLSDHKLIKKAFQTRDFTARPKTAVQALLGGYGKSIFESYCVDIYIISIFRKIYKFILSNIENIS